MKTYKIYYTNGCIVIKPLHPLELAEIIRELSRPNSLIKDIKLFAL